MVDAVRGAVIGADGVVGARLMEALAAAGHSVVAMPPEPETATSAAAGHSSAAGHPEALVQALSAVDTVYYLPELAGEGFDFEERARRSARGLAFAAEIARVGRIVYLAGLADDAATRSAPVRTRNEVGELLRAGRTPVTEVRAGPVIAAGAPSFTMLRELVERLPVMIMPRWAATSMQPVALDDLVSYLRAAGEEQVEGDAVYQVGGPEVMTYRSMMERYARWRGLPRRWMLLVPLFTPRLSSLWVELVTSIPASQARPLIEGLRDAQVVRDRNALERFGAPEIPFEEALRRAARDDGAPAPRGAPLLRFARHLALILRRLLWNPVLTDERVQVLPVRPQVAWRTATAVGGWKGYPVLGWAWDVRGMIDRLLGGPGLDRHGPSADQVVVGDRLDFWEVVEMDPGRRLRMRALMKVPGDAELEIAVRERRGQAVIVQVARFRPRGLAGRLYWWLLYPAHWIIFRGMIQRVTRKIREEGGR